MHQILVNDRFWTAQPGVLCQRYEDLIADPVTGVEQLAAHLGLTLAPGDIIATGTPAGVGIGFNPPKYLRPGDVVRIEIAGIGVLENPVARLAEAAA